MRVAVIGAGGVGGYFGGRMAAAGRDVVFVARGAHGAALKERGLTLRSDVGDLDAVPVSVVDRPDLVGDVDLVLLCMKLWDTAAVAAALVPVVRPDTTVVSLQNGIDAEDLLIKAFGPERVLGGLCQISAAIDGPGTIRQVGEFARVVVGELGGGTSRRAGAVRDCLDVDGVTAVESADIKVDIWLKFIFLVALSGATASARQSIGPILADPDGRARFAALIAETAALARAEGVALPDRIEAKTMERADRLPGGMKASMLVDLERGNRLELDWLAGTVVRRSEALGLAAPENAAVYTALAPYAEGGGASAS